jgi:hypothetical protein
MPARALIDELRALGEVQSTSEFPGIFRRSLSRMNDGITGVSRELGVMRDALDYRLRSLAKTLTPEQKREAEEVDSEIKKLEHTIAKFWFESGFEKRLRALDDLMGFLP